MKSFNLTIALLVFLNATTAFAKPSNSQEISFNFDKLQYEIQSGILKSEKDIAKATEAMLSNLKTQDITDIEVMDYIRNAQLTATQRADFDRIISALKFQNATKEEYVAQISNYFQNTQAQGASFSGEAAFRTTVVVGLGVMLTLVVVALLVQEHKCSRNEHRRECN